MIGPGAIACILKHGDIAWVIKWRDTFNDRRWTCVTKRIDGGGREALTVKTAGEGDIIVIKPAPVYEPGATVTYDGIQYTVHADLGDAVELVVPASRYPLSDGVHLVVAEGNKTTITKAELVLAALERPLKEKKNEQ